MKKLSALKPQIQIDTAFFDKLKLSVLNSVHFYDYVDNQKSDKPSGIKVTCVILEDNYSSEKYEAHTNEFEKIDFKIRGETNLNLFTYKDEVRPYNLKKVVIYGDFSNLLSIECSLKKVDDLTNRISRSTDFKSKFDNVAK